jgi:hypothetical protein
MVVYQVICEGLVGQEFGPKPGCCEIIHSVDLDVFKPNGVRDEPGLRGSTVSIHQYRQDVGC